ncbi:caspase family protein [Nocardia amikacinitolerans]|uniref:caspase family protein n=1 Tax=Nocardia amikacinitolerans TaxID=756689 RepID=UPI00368FA231
MTKTSTRIRRAAVCIGVDRVGGGLVPLHSAASGAVSMAVWAETQGCEVRLHTDGPNRGVRRCDVLASINKLVDERVYDQLVIYFAGHGLVPAPGTETWLLTDAAEDSSEAVNVLLTAEYARRAGIAHVVLISDACRSYVNGPPFYGLHGAEIIRKPVGNHDPADIDIYFATRPGNPAYELLPEDHAGYGIFTRCLLEIVGAPPHDIIDHITIGAPSASTPSRSETIPVVTSRALKQPLIDAVSAWAIAIDPLLDQRPEIRVETALPQYFATVESVSESRGVPDEDHGPLLRRGAGPFIRYEHRPNRESQNRAAMKSSDPVQKLADSLRLPESLHAVGRRREDWHPFPESVAWIVVRGADVLGVTVVGWELAENQSDRSGTQLLVLVSTSSFSNGDPTSAVLQFADGTGTIVILTPGAAVAVVVEDGRVAGMQYYSYDSLLDPAEVDMQSREVALITYEAQNGSLPDSSERSESRGPLRFRGWRSSNAAWVERLVSLTLRGYGTAERGRFAPGIFDDSLSDRIISFDVALLASRAVQQSGVGVNGRRVKDVIEHRLFYPFSPLLTRGWLLLGDDPAVARPFHKLLSRHLIPALYTTFDPNGVMLAHDITVGEDR